jgi:ribosomal protein S18 acetylase RimI-like enzyme
MTEISLRDARIEDAGGIAQVHVDSWRAAYRGLLDDAELDGLSVHGRTVQWRDRLTRGVETLLALHGDEPAGFCALRRERGSPVEIAALYVDPSRFGEGVGTLLLGETLARLRAGGEPEVALWVLEGNARARAFYDRHGFDPTGERDQWHGAQEVRLRRRLTS